MTNGFIIQTTPIAVDYWNVKTKPYVQFFFLTHCHSDHTSGLTKSWRRKIYCSSITAKLANHLCGVNPNLFIHLDVDETRTIDYGDESGKMRSFHVTALDADHCPGAVMFLFEGWFGRILCTGDFRYEEDSFSINIEHLQFGNFDRIYLDATSWRNDLIDLPTRKVALKAILDKIAERPVDEDILLVMPQMKLGKEKLLIEIATRFGKPLCVDEDRLRVMELLEHGRYVTNDATDTRFHVIGAVKKRDVLETVNCFRCRGRTVFVLIVTSLPHWRDFITECNGYSNRSLTKDNVAVIPYSDHSSRKELETFLTLLTIRDIILIGSRKDDSLTANERLEFLTQDISSIVSTETAVVDEDLLLSKQCSNAAVITRYEEEIKLITPAASGPSEIAKKHHQPDMILKPNELDIETELTKTASVAIVEPLIVTTTECDGAACGDDNDENNDFEEPQFLIKYNDIMIFTDAEIDELDKFIGDFYGKECF